MIGGVHTATEAVGGRYAPLFQPLRLGPVTIPNRFYQVPHCNGMHRHHPSALARMRGLKAEGGWGAVCTEQCDIHYSSCHPRELRLWDQRDLPNLRRITEEIHAAGALAGIELAHNGFHVHNWETRAIPLAPSHVPTRGNTPTHARAMDLQDIRDLRRWHRNAAMNARLAGFDIVYVYAAHDMTLPAHFLSRRHNTRTDEYGGSLENRVRLMRELLEDTKDAIGGSCAVALRFSVDELRGSSGLCWDGEARDVIHMIAEIPDLWDVNLSDFGNDGQTSRFSDEGYQDDYIGFVKSVTSKPVVGVGRHTSPDRMVALLSSGKLDLIGAARPSIADPFLPQKIMTGRIEDIRECIGCNICVASDKLAVPIRCTQNPTIGEEWRRGWHPERIDHADSDDRILIVGAGPAGLEAATWLGRRGYDTTLAEESLEYGGRARREAALPGLHAWRRVIDWRLGQLQRDPHVTLLPGNRITVDVVLESDFSIVAVATGARWRSDGTGRSYAAPIPGYGSIPTFTPDDIMMGRLPQGRVLVFDDDHNYMGGVVAELLCSHGCEVMFVTPESLVSAWTTNTAEQPRIQRRLLERCRDVLVSTTVTRFEDGTSELACVFTGRKRLVRVDAVVLVTALTPQDSLYRGLMNALIGRAEGPPRLRLVRIGDCMAAGTIAAAVFSGHLFARTLHDGTHDLPPFRRDITSSDWHQPLDYSAFRGSSHDN